MSEDRRETIVFLAQSAMTALLDACRDEDGASYIDPDSVIPALVACMASVVAADERVKTRRDMRIVADAFARDLRQQVESLRAHFDATGEQLSLHAEGMSSH